MSELLDVRLPEVTLRALTWGDPADADRPLALLLHGFPDTAHTWRHLGPRLAEEGYRVVAPFTRGYGPSEIPVDGSFHVPALVSDAIGVHRVLGGDHRAVVVGHDWGAITANALAACPDAPFARVVAMAVPPLSAMGHLAPDPLGYLTTLARQARMSWYIGFNQLPRLPEARFDRLVAGLWAAWSPGYDASVDLAYLRRSVDTPERRSAVLGYYRAFRTAWRPPARYRAHRRCWLADPIRPLLYLHGADDGCLNPRYVERVAAHLPPGSRALAVPGAGHFLNLERPDVVAAEVLAHLGAG
ncbi:alpha/beta hydrolase [Nocardioides fonticola]|uniref:Alpha/beta hydrolase n=1 Tax=Nocardioides fonticola TaxID=450363 RepID=A0ABP7XHY0_9ACTN